ncbi:RluA family pseudouridine synthase [Gracilinema caldarium]|uniref:Pseudouridine synthase n=1 Tax=Gracilinema caldarium (strain ATCC 51460 / DSM 7334 / H1) TaxID=744872 RepID=F8F1T6_GRAC1|nr:RluA family pseudouridine synthase [Gracilinema caldarium]AEJ19420.1 pseudouridine synthase [Gracilinema caldarium DSM 7334]
MAFTAQITENDQNRRLDRIVRKALPQLPLSAIHKMFRKGQVYIDGKPVPASFKPQLGSILEIPELVAETPQKIPITRGKVSKAPPVRLQSTDKGPSFQILFENEALLFINKEAGIPVHGKDSLALAVQTYLGPKLSPSLSFRPGPLHRLDQGTSGIITFSKNLMGAQCFSIALREHRLEKWYVALLQGCMTEPAQWTDTLIRDQNRRMSNLVSETDAGKQAITRVYPLFHTAHTHNPATLVFIKLETGRTHQIRVQAAHHGYPLLGDIKYGAKKQARPWVLHAYTLAGLGRLDLGLPDSIQAPLPDVQVIYLKTLFTEIKQRLFIQRLQETTPITDLLGAIIK